MLPALSQSSQRIYPALDLEHFPDSVRREWQSVSKSERVQRVRTGIDIVETEINRML
ncbi:hypothetical protein [Nostoc sp.]|uniref:hypothetical protein n=1 Tax=Nostoc sp. TaxID=1180 RepID=UPI002FF858FD